MALHFTPCRVILFYFINLGSNSGHGSILSKYKMVCLQTEDDVPDYALSIHNIMI